MSTGPTTASPAPATTLADALDALDPQPLEFEGEHANGAVLYAPRPARIEDGLTVAGPADTLRRRLLGSAAATKVFLSGHVGSGKSTEIKRLQAAREIRGAFSPIFLAIEEAYRLQLDIAQLLFLIAAALLEHARKEQLVSQDNDNAWLGPLRELDRRIFGASGVQVQEGTVGVEIDLFLVRLRDELKLEERRRRQFREIGETDLTILTSLIGGIDLDIRKNLVLRGDSRSPLLLIDDLDKVREPGPQEDVFRRNLPALLGLPLRVLFTVPTGVAFDRCPSALREALVHLYPVPILKKAPASFDPEEAINEVGLPFLDAVLRTRVAPGLIDAEAIRKAGVYSGGVLRTFFRLLRAGIELARYNNLGAVDGRVMKVAIKDVRLNETLPLREAHYRALAEVHRTNQLAGGADGSYLDYSYAIECYNDKVWYEANPLLWLLLKPQEK
jgi:hypothetical protein